MNYAPPRPDPSLPPVRVNLYSDTQTRPTAAMKAAMMAAEVGDEQAGQDPSIWALCDRMASFLGKEAAVFLPSGTMCNQIAIITHCRPGDEILAHASAHILNNEGSGGAALAGAQITGLSGPRGQFDADAVRAALRPRGHRHAPAQALLEVEQTANAGGGTVWPLAQLNAVAAVAHEAGMATHMDGARLTNATVAAGIAASDMVAGYDSVWLDFTKGLGAPLGAVLCGTSDFIGEAWRWKQRMGGAMRQGGICAAACLYALDHHVERLAEDHENARNQPGVFRHQGHRADRRRALRAGAPARGDVLLQQPLARPRLHPSGRLGGGDRRGGERDPRRRQRRGLTGRGCVRRSNDRAMALS